MEVMVKKLIIAKQSKSNIVPHGGTKYKKRGNKIEQLKIWLKALALVSLLRPKRPKK